MLVLYPIVPLARRQALGIAVMSYDGHLGFGLLGDYDALPDLEDLSQDLSWAIGALTRTARAKTKDADVQRTTARAAPARPASAKPSAATTSVRDKAPQPPKPRPARQRRGNAHKRTASQARRHALRCAWPSAR